ncbi:chemotaxis protein CheB [Silvibacterium acidisoli]|uniref:chemotaxis protein CheB n=1 Tax=Acidobacteriaceae bacterium ZG23-2 TaxID=2883246 RepID=UPI00406C1775
MSARNVVVIGASAGGVEAVRKLISLLPADLPAAVFITLHLPERGQSPLTDIFSRESALPVIHPWEETEIQEGHIYVAPPDFHLLPGSHTVRLSRGPKENLMRPCINTMFRSAAEAHAERVIGVVLTGLLDDGAAGLWEIQQRGGVTVVQHPEEATFSSMPQNAIRGVKVQHILRIAEIPAVISEVVRRENMAHIAPVREPVTEEPAIQSCPECQGAMKRHTFGRLIGYSCHIGHRFSQLSMIAEKSAVVEQSLWKALSQSEELVVLLEEVYLDADEASAPALLREIHQRKASHAVLERMMERSSETPLL